MTDLDTFDGPQTVVSEMRTVSWACMNSEDYLCGGHQCVCPCHEETDAA